MDESPLDANAPYLDNRGFHPSGSLAWVEVSPGTPCPRCGATEGCSLSPDGRFVRCRLVVSAHPLEDGGWLHLPPTAAGADR
jgi:hypothetical protein